MFLSTLVLTYLHIMFYVYSIQVLYHYTKYVGKAFLASVQAWVIWMMLVLCIDTGCTKFGRSLVGMPHSSSHSNFDSDF